MAGIIALMAYVGSPECSGPRKSESILDGARLSSNETAAEAAERFPMLSAEVLSEITGESDRKVDSNYSLLPTMARSKR
jgi:hypothetical protein